jgi:hypothetical protein
MRLQAASQVLDIPAQAMLKHVNVRNPGLVYKFDEARCGNWEGLLFEAMIPLDLTGTPIHASASMKVKHQTMRGCIYASGETLCPLLFPKDTFHHKFSRMELKTTWIYDRSL